MHKIFGRVVYGEKIGRQLGFPTANLDRRMYARRKLEIRFGVWAGHAFTPDGKKRRAGIVIGPKDKKGLPKIEAHLLGFSGDLYGKKLSLSLSRYLRPFKKYKSGKALRGQIEKDVEKIKSMEF